MRNKTMRQKTHGCGNHYKEVDIYPRFIGNDLTDWQRAENAEREKQESTLAQKAINERNARRHLIQLTAANFTERGIHLSLTYKDEFLPLTIEDALADRVRFFRSMQRLCKRKGVPPPKYIGVTEYQTEDKANHIKAVRFHHHIILECDLTRDETESLWSRGRGKNKEMLGHANADRLQFEKGRIEALCQYITKYAKHKRRWTQSLNLKQPVHHKPRDGVMSPGKVERLCTTGVALDAEYWEARHKGWQLAEAKPVFNEFTGWSIYLKFFKPFIKGER